jgi:EAL domain-containing protein (putative c-di-GMP-specific phosphodiesterase class I)
MERISCRGYRFLLDDFGSGFSNFNCLLSLPFSRVKLDKSLTDTVDGKNADVVRMLTDFFHKANLEVIAEGVETAEQVAALTSYGVDKIQGYHFAAPMSQPLLLDFYRENKA